MLMTSWDEADLDNVADGVHCYGTSHHQTLASIKCGSVVNLQLRTRLGVVPGTMTIPAEQNSSELYTHFIRYVINLIDRYQAVPYINNQGCIPSSNEKNFKTEIGHGDLTRELHESQQKDESIWPFLSKSVYFCRGVILIEILVGVPPLTMVNGSDVVHCSWLPGQVSRM